MQYAQPYGGKCSEVRVQYQKFRTQTGREGPRGDKREELC